MLSSLLRKSALRRVGSSDEAGHGEEGEEEAGLDLLGAGGNTTAPLHHFTPHSPSPPPNGRTRVSLQLQ